MKVIDESDLGTKTALRDQQAAIDKLRGCPRAPDRIGDKIPQGAFIQHTLHECELFVDEVSGLETLVVTPEAQALQGSVTRIGAKNITVNVSAARIKLGAVALDDDVGAKV